MLAAVSPSASCHDETLNTLRFANQAKNILNDPKVNEVSFDLRKQANKGGTKSTKFEKHLTVFTVYFLIASEDWGTVREHKQRRRREREKSKTTTLPGHHAFLYISLPSLHDCDVKISNFTFFGEHEHKRTTFFFCS